ncbi:hypothetical protein DRW48_12260 [Paracoccus suum]|uniref:Ribbon-helix-helix domain-containing protein n=1 Tax=Paracoccus suum TaxID=2259340 RepID=A0A344PLV6_9RHOB|nr:ribbon-helix-helix domain-containing protein [Paracoccus suum]AXC50361.1 hypothetical protein DRW48_12260 [Paracoccus suum]
MIDLPPMDRPRKRSVMVEGHPTSVSLEDAFWSGLRRMAQSEGLGLSQLVAEIDRRRPVEVGLATAIRLAVLARREQPPAEMADARHQVGAARQDDPVNDGGR